MSQNTQNSSTFKIVEPPEYSNEDCIKRLELLLAKAKAGKITDYFMVYFDEREHGFSHSYRGHKKSALMGLMFVLMTQIATNTYELEPQDE